MTQSIEPSFSIWLKELNPFFEHDSQKLFWIITQRIVFSKNMTHKTQRIEPSFHKWLEDLTFLFQICLIEVIFFFWKKDDSKNWFSENINQIIQTLFWWLKEMSFFFFWKTWLIEIELFLHDSKNWTLFWIWLKELKIFMIFWLKELNLFWIWLEKVNFFEEKHDPQNWTIFSCDHGIEPFFPKWVI